MTALLEWLSWIAWQVVLLGFAILQPVIFEFGVPV